MKRGFLNKGFSTSKADSSQEVKRGRSDTKKIHDPLKEAARQNDGSSSSGPIPDTFEKIGGNTELAEAQVICLGEAHIPQHHNDIVDFINAHAKDGDILLVEGVQAHEKLDKGYYLCLEAEFNELREPKSLLKDIQVYGWDDISERDRQIEKSNEENALRVIYSRKPTNNLMKKIALLHELCCKSEKKEINKC